MGKHQAMSVPWIQLEEAIQANPNKGARLREGAASASLAAMPIKEKTLSWLPGWTEDSSVADPVALVLWILDPLYRTATPAIRRGMEMEEASALLHTSEASWKEKNGRLRGWVRKHLEEDLRDRAAGGEPSPDAWASPHTTKRAALLLDYICIMKSIRIGLWWPERGLATVFPMTGLDASIPIVQVNCTTGRILFGPGGFKLKASEWPALRLSTEIQWTPPLSAPSIGAQTVAQIQERLATLIPGLPTKGSRATLWSYLLYELFRQDINGLSKEIITHVE
jgi:hypothetical protein